MEKKESDSNKRPKKVKTEYILYVIFVIAVIFIYLYNKFQG